MIDSYLELLEEERDNYKEQADIVLNPKFIPIYPSMLRDGFSFYECAVYGFIDFFTGSGKKFYCTNKQIGDMLGTSEKTISLAVKTLIKEDLIQVSYSIKSGGGKIRFIQKGRNVISDFTPGYSQTLLQGNEIENKIIKEKDKSFSKGGEKICNLEELLNGYKTHPTLPRMLTDESLVKEWIQYKQAKKDRAYTSVPGFLQQLLVNINKVRFGKPRGDTNMRFEFAMNQAMEGKWKGLVWNENIEQDYQSWKTINQLTQKQNE